MVTRHAQVRMQQRGVPPLILEWLLKYGAIEHDGHGGHVRYFDCLLSRVAPVHLAVCRYGMSVKEL